MDAHLEQNFISTREAAKLSGYNSDYLGRLCREGKIEATRIGRAWIVNKNSLLSFVADQEEQKKKNAEALAQAREVEYKAAQEAKVIAPVVVEEAPVEVVSLPTAPVIAASVPEEVVVETLPEPVIASQEPVLSPIQLPDLRKKSPITIREIRDRAVAAVIALLIVTGSFVAAEVGVVTGVSRIAVKTIENTSDIGYGLASSILAAGGAELASVAGSGDAVIQHAVLFLEHLAQIGWDIAGAYSQFQADFFQALGEGILVVDLWLGQDAAVDSDVALVEQGEDDAAVRAR